MLYLNPLSSSAGWILHFINIQMVEWNTEQRKEDISTWIYKFGFLDIHACENSGIWLGLWNIVPALLR